MISNFINAVKTDGRYVISITGQIGWDFSANEMLQYLNYYKEDALLFEIFSFGGAAFDALAIYDYIRTNGMDVKANIYGFCGSAATIISCAASEVGIGENSFFFVHNAFNEWTGKEDDQSEKVTDRLVEIYAKKTGMDRRRIRKMMKEGSENNVLIGAADALEMGFVDKVLKEKASVAASIFSRFSNNLPVAGGDSQTQNTTTKMENKFNLATWVKSFWGDKASDVETEEQAQQFLSSVEKTEENPAAVVAEADLNKIREDNEAAVSQLREEFSGQFDALTEQIKSLTEAVTAKFQANAETEAQKEAEKSKFEENIQALAGSIDALKGIPSGGTPKVDAAAHSSATHEEKKESTTKSKGFEWSPKFN